MPTPPSHPIARSHAAQCSQASKPPIPQYPLQNPKFTSMPAHREQTLGIPPSILHPPSSTIFHPPSSITDSYTSVTDASILYLPSILHQRTTETVVGRRKRKRDSSSHYVRVGAALLFHGFCAGVLYSYEHHGHHGHDEHERGVVKLCECEFVRARDTSILRHFSQSFKISKFQSLKVSKSRRPIASNPQHCLPVPKARSDLQS
ncbi:hypothetical protein PC9H_002731 [Pleurotus ostreatus]|uniref:Uncharacterized protein n=1 Tax=Pleurotus ostreatus TaxID=5322 RepID=A0A8H6ZHC9_PLEOS|nr:uncharacterized protein PC9H_002731 [Pleurotus ostreatus]KAF7416465.1 hypothetical protein PC9H_002731 [Pleurotus ostreatus]